MTHQLSHFINGEAVSGTSGRTAEAFNPATGEVDAIVPLASKAEVETAIASAEAAFPAWSATPAARRAQVLFKYRELLMANLDEVAELVSRQHGKTLPDAKGEVIRGLEVVEFASGIPHIMKGEMSEQVAGKVDTYSS
ncbi:MAG: aldehyde dehydrogenase family protein, partial [Rhodospirillaceae bacterium]|nr:aldehyde dehydrogenase family protein [Rhodospirillaceae bacterium]